MILYPLNDHGDGIQQLGTVPDTDAVSACGAAISGTFFVRSNMRAECEPKPEVHAGICGHQRVPSLNY